MQGREIDKIADTLHKKYSGWRGEKLEKEEREGEREMGNKKSIIGSSFNMRDGQ